LASLTVVKGTVVVAEGTVDSDFRQVARTHRLSILEAPSARVAYRAVCRLDPWVIVVQLSRPGGEAFEFIRLAANSTLSAPLVAIAVVHMAGIEQAAREAGAGWYLPDVTSPVVDQVLTAVMWRRS
jgi:DNA-binding NarL/FixJ family response regulator